MDIVKFHPNERVGLPDFEPATGKLQLLDGIRENRVLQLPAGRTTGTANTGMRVFGGFVATIPTSTTVQLTSGTGILSWLDRSTLHHGIAVGDQAPSSYTLDFSTASPGTYAIYARFVYSDGSQENRVFWNPAAVPPGEAVTNVATRQTATWEATYQDAALSPPGSGEWIKLWEATVIAGPSVSALDDFRHLYFEGDVNFGNYTAAEWGDGANDRAVDRGTYPITDWHMFVQMVRRQLRDILYPDIPYGHVYEVPIALSNLDDEHWGSGGSPTEKGRHKNITVGADTRFWDIQTQTVAGPAQALRLRDATSGISGEVTIRNAPDGTLMELLMQPRSAGVDLSTGDAIEIRGGDSGNQLRLRHEIQAADQQRTVLWGSGDEDFSFLTGTGHTFPGMHSERGYYFKQAQSMRIYVPAEIGAANSYGGWREGTGSSNAFNGIRTSASSIYSVMVVDWLPENAALNSVDVTWVQESVETTNKLRLYVLKCQNTVWGPGIPGGDAVSEINLNSSSQFVEFGAGGSGQSPAVGAWGIDRFAVDQNFTFQRSQGHFLVLRLRSCDTGTSWVMGFTLNFTYQWATHLPLTNI